MTPARMRQDEGYTLIEMLVGIVLMSIVMSVAAGSAVHAMKIQRRQVAEVEAVGRARIAMQRMTREIRAANPLLVATTDGREISVQVTRGDVGDNRKITTYRLVGDTIEASGMLINTSTMASTPLPTTVLLRGLKVDTGQAIFSYRLADGTAPLGVTDLTLYRTVEIRLPMALRDSTSTVNVRDSVTVRNSRTQ